MLTTGTQWDVMARTLYGEGRGEPYDGQIAIAYVILNRAKAGWRGAKNVEDVCLQAWQFSSWNQGDPNRAKILAVTKDDPAFRRALGITALVISEDLPDFSRGATHYFATIIPAPAWADNMTETAHIGRHRFFK